MKHPFWFKFSFLVRQKKRNQILLWNNEDSKKVVLETKSTTPSAFLFWAHVFVGKKTNGGLILLNLYLFLLQLKQQAVHRVLHHLLHNHKKELLIRNKEQKMKTSTSTLPVCTPLAMGVVPFSQLAKSTPLLYPINLLSTCPRPFSTHPVLLPPSGLTLSFRIHHSILFY